MSPLAVAKVAGRALRRNKARSALTMLGVVIGVGAVAAGELATRFHRPFIVHGGVACPGANDHSPCITSDPDRDDGRALMNESPSVPRPPS